MAIGHGSSAGTVSAANSNPITLPVNPTVAPVGALVFVAHGEIPTDLVTGVTYGGVVMPRKVTVADSTGTNPDQRGRSYIYALEGGVPAGAQNVVVTRTGTAVVFVAVWTQTGNQTMQVVGTASVSGVNHPQVSLARAGRACLGYLIAWGGVQGPSAWTAPLGFLRGPDTDFGTHSAGVFREQQTSTVDAAHLVDQADANSALCGIVVAEAVGAPPPSGSTDHCCGAECGIVTPTLGVATAHWNLAAGPAPTSQTGRARRGGRAFRFAPVGAVNYLGRTLAGGTQRWERFYVFFDGALPDRNCTLFHLGLAGAGSSPGIAFDATANALLGKFGSTWVGKTSLKPVVPNVWYRVELLADVSANPHTLQVRVCGATPSDPEADGASTALTSGTVAQAADSWQDLRLGAGCLGVVTAIVVIDDHLTGSGAAGYPAGPSTIVGAQPVADGTHNFNATGDFRSATVDLVPGVTTAWTQLAGLLTDGSSLLHAAGAATGEYLELLAGGVPAMSSVRALEMVSVHKGATLTAHKQTLRWLSGASADDVLTDADFSESTLVQFSKHYTAMPGGGAFSQANLNASKWRFASSFVAALTGGQIAGLMMEIDGVLTGASPPPPGSVEKNPTHIYSSPGTYQVTLTVRDNDGLERSITKAVLLDGLTSTINAGGFVGSGALGATLRSRRLTAAPFAGSGALGATLELVPATPSTGTFRLELRQGASLRAWRELPGADLAAGGTSTRWQMVLTAEEQATLTSGGAELWLIANGGTERFRVTRFRMFVAT